MSDFDVQRRFASPLVTGALLVVIAFCVSLIYWPLLGTACKAAATALAGKGLQNVDSKTAVQFFNVFTQGMFFWLFVIPWMWQTISFGNYGKTYLTDRQPYAGLWYLFVSVIAGTVGFLTLIGFIGLWWKPFELAILFTPQTAEEVHLAIEGWETGNFYALATILVHIGYVALFHKWPFAGNIKPPGDGFGTFMTSTAFCLLVWIAMIVPSLMGKLSLGGHVIVAKPFGSWPAFVAFCQAFILVFLIPAEGGENYPMKFFTAKQPFMGVVGLAIAVLGGLIIPPAVRAIVAPMNLVPGMPPDVVVASLILSVVSFLLTWHHLFEDYPSAARQSNKASRLLSRLAIWLIGGSVCGIVWLKIFVLLPYGANDLGMGIPGLGILSGQFAFLLIILYANTFFDKWPLVYKEERSKAIDGVLESR